MLTAKLARTVRRVWEFAGGKVQRRETPGAPVATTDDDLSWLIAAKEDVPRYPPFMRGLPAEPPATIVESQSDLMLELKRAAYVSDAEFETYYITSVLSFAAFVQLLPASESHHHKGAGGLFRHSLEVGLWALRGANKRMLRGVVETPEERKKLEPKWRYAVFVGGLFHDIGKPATDMVISNKDHSLVWTPAKCSMWEWLKANKIDRYYLHWRPGRGQQHVAMTSVLARQVLPVHGLEWIASAQAELMVWMFETLNGMPSGDNQIHPHVLAADQLSTSRDLKSMGVVMAGYEFGVPVERVLSDLMRMFVRTGRWDVNKPGARIWVLQDVPYLVWKTSATDLVAELTATDTAGVPRYPEGLLDVMLRNGMIELDHGQLYRVAPAGIVTKDGKALVLECVRLINDTLVSREPLASVEGHVIARVDAAQAVQSPAPADQPEQDAHKPDDQKPARAAKSGVATSDATAAVVNAASKPAAEPRNDDSGKEAGIQELTQSAPTNQKARLQADPNITELEGQVGEQLKALAEDLASGKDKRWGRDAFVSGDGELMVTWPTGMSYGVEDDELTHLVAQARICRTDEAGAEPVVEKLETEDGEIDVIKLWPSVTELFAHALKHFGGGDMQQHAQPAAKRKHDERKPARKAAPAKSVASKVAGTSAGARKSRAPKGATSKAKASKTKAPKTKAPKVVLPKVAVPNKEQRESASGEQGAMFLFGDSEPDL